MTCKVDRVRLGLEAIAAAADKGWRVNGERWGAIAISSDSELDRCLIIPKLGDVVRLTSGVTDEPDKLTRLGAGILVSVERPYIGPIEGPLRVLPPYATHALTSDTATNEIAMPRDLDYYNQSAPAFLGLDLYDEAPPWLPTARAPLDYHFRIDDASTLGGPRTIRVPCFGRREVSVSLKMSGYSSGTFRWKLEGVNHVDYPLENDGGDEFSKELQADDDNTANFDETYFFDGEFDLLEFTLTEQAAMGAGARISGLVKLRD